MSAEPSTSKSLGAKRVRRDPESHIGAEQSQPAPIPYLNLQQAQAQQPSSSIPVLNRIPQSSSPHASEGRIQESPKRLSLAELKLVDPEQQLIMQEYDHLWQEMERQKKVIGEKRAYLEGHKGEKLADVKLASYEFAIQNQSRASEDYIACVHDFLGRHYCYVQNREELGKAESELAELESRFERLKKYRDLVHCPALVPDLCRRIRVSPLEYGRHSIFYDYQDDDETRVLCRISGSASGLNVMFQCREFFQFAIDTERIEVDSHDVSNARKFVNRTMKLYATDNKYIEKAIVPFCNEYLCPSSSGFSVGRLSVGQCETDITIGYVNRRAEEELLDWKVLVGNIVATVSETLEESDADIQNIWYYIKMIESLKYRSIQPMFLVTFAGPTLRIFGVICNKKQIFVNRLCDYIDLEKEYGCHQDDYTSFAQVFKSLRKGMMALGQRYLNEQDPFPAYSPTSLSVEIDGFGVYERFTEMIFTSSDKTRCIKICESYCPESQGLLSSAGLAPRMTREAKIVKLGKRKFIIVEMEFLDGYKNIHDLEDFIKRLGIDQKREILEKLERALRILHSRGFVHGDLRGTNIMVHKDTLDIKVVDFDFCGKEGTVVYPSLLDVRREAQWHPVEVKSGVLIKKEHDLFSLEHLVDKYKLNSQE